MIFVPSLLGTRSPDIQAALIPAAVCCLPAGRFRGEPCVPQRPLKKGTCEFSSATVLCGESCSESKSYVD